MGKVHILFSLSVLLISAFALPAAAQDDADVCPTVVEAALEAVGDACALLGRSEACYGNARVEANFWEARPELVFEAPADVVPLAEVQQIITAPLDVDTGEWGITVLRMQPAGGAALAPGQVVTFLLMGDVALENQIAPDAEDKMPMQAFSFSAGMGAPACEEAPNALLVQSPEDVEVSFTINGMEVSLGSTLLLTMAERESGAALMMTLLQGKVSSAFAGTAFTMDEPGQAAGVTLNAEGMVDATSQIVDVNPDTLAPKVEHACTGAMATGLFDAVDCDMEVTAPITAGGGCTVMADHAVNRRGGPGTHYPVQGVLEVGEEAGVAGQAPGADGFTWWQLGDGTWAREDVVNAGGACDAVPVVENIPEPPAAPPAEEEEAQSLPAEEGEAQSPPAESKETPPDTSSGESLPAGMVRFGLNGPDACQPPAVAVGATLRIYFGTGFDNPGDRDSHMNASSSQITVNGQSIPVTRHPEDQPSNYHYLTEGTWVASAPGTYSIVGIDAVYGNPETWACTVQVQ